jgi:hypothetical protein
MRPERFLQTIDREKDKGRCAPEILNFLINNWNAIVDEYNARR